MKKEILGIDLGRTIIAGVDSDKEKSPFPDAIRVIRRLISERFGDRVYIISKVTPQQKISALEWIEKNKLHEVSGIPKERLIFCAERADKAPICRKLGITHFIDDRPEVMIHIDPSVSRFLFQPNQTDLPLFLDKLNGVVTVNSWIEIENLLLPR